MSCLDFVRCAALMTAVLTSPSFAQHSAVSYHGYAVGIGDTISVLAFQHSDISGDFLVEESGAISFPLLGSIPVAGLTTLEISKSLEELLEKDYYVDVQLQVEVTDYRSQPVTVFGEVQRPGTYYLKGRTTLTQIGAEAGGLRSTAGPVLELRRVEQKDGEDVLIVYTFSTEKLLSGEEGAAFELWPGDVISVSAKKLYFVTGEVASPGKYEITLSMTLYQAITQAGGLGKFASQTVELHRDLDGEKQILTFDLSDIRKGKSDDPPVNAGDVIIVRRRFF